MLDYFSVQQSAIVQKDIGQGPLLLRVVLVASCGIRWIKLQPHTFASTMWRVNWLASLPKRSTGFFACLTSGVSTPMRQFLLDWAVGSQRQDKKTYKTKKRSSTWSCFKPLIGLRRRAQLL
jgi:hypothetical protein